MKIDVEWQLPDTRCRLVIENPFVHPASSIEYPVSSIEYPVSATYMQNDLFNIPVGLFKTIILHTELA